MRSQRILWSSWRVDAVKVGTFTRRAVLGVAALLAACTGEPSDEASCEAPERGTSMLAPEWVQIPAGSFTTGTADEDRYEHPSMSVTLSSDYWIQSSDVTRAELNRVVSAAYSAGLAPVWFGESARKQQTTRDPFAPATEMLPYILSYAYYRSMLDGEEPCYDIDRCEFSYLTEDGRWNPDGLQPGDYEMQNCAVWLVSTVGTDCDSYRLPTEAEWEWAARAAGEEPCVEGGRCVEDMAWARDVADGFGRGNVNEPVGGKCPNAAGLYDLYGGAAERTADFFDASAPFFVEPHRVDPIRNFGTIEYEVRGVTNQINFPDLDERPWVFSVVRGGMGTDAYSDLRAYATWKAPVLDRGVSFRLVRNTPPPTGP